MKKAQPWTPEEDLLLIELHNQAGCFQRWKFISKKLKEQGISKTQFQCRDRFTNHVNPCIKHGKLSNSEIAKLFGLYDQYGPRWSFFETKIYGRPQSLLKNKFYSTLRSLVRHFIKAGQKRNLNVFSAEILNLSSKMLIELYEGRKKFSSYKNILKNCLKCIRYCIENESLEQYLNELDPQIMERLFKSICQNSGGKPTLFDYQKLIGSQQNQNERKLEHRIQNLQRTPPKKVDQIQIQPHEIKQDKLATQPEMTQFKSQDWQTIPLTWNIVYSMPPLAYCFYPL